MDERAVPLHATPEEWLAATLPRLADRIGDAIRDGNGLAAEPYLGAFLSRGNAVDLAACLASAEAPADRKSDPFGGRAAAHLPVGRLIAAFGLPADFADLAALILAPEVDARFGRLFAYLNDDATRRWPTAATAQQILGALPAPATALFAETAPLLAFHLIESMPPGAALIDRPLRWTDRMVRFLLGTGGGIMDEPALAGCRRTVVETALADLVPDEAERRALRRAAMAPVFALLGPAGSGRTETAAALIRETVRTPVCLDAALLAGLPGPETRRILRLGLREAALAGGSLILANADALGRAALAPPLSATPCPVIVTAAAQLDLNIPGHQLAPLEGERLRAVWAAAAGPGRQDLARQLAERFKLPVRAIFDAVRMAGAEPGIAEIAAACRQRSDQELDQLAVQVPARHDWDDLVLPPRQMARLKAMVRRIEDAGLVYDDWGFARKLAPFRSLSALFPGPSGTGKTLSAGIIARALGLRLYKVDLAAIVSKYIGETEKNLERIFTASEVANAVLFFDEADALFGKRSEVKDAHDRYANIETSYLLQRMERHRGIVILATNLAQNIDEAFTRRIDVIVEFPQPDAAARTRLWRILVPPEAALAADVDPASLGSNFELSGGEIRNCLITAAFLAVADEGPITMAHCVRAVALEFEKTGRPLTRAKFGDAFAEVRSRRSG